MPVGSDESLAESSGKRKFISTGENMVIFCQMTVRNKYVFTSFFAYSSQHLLLIVNF
jgi:hypothetical protein